MKLWERVAIVTGGAAGIGRGIVLRLVEEGANIAVVDIDVEKANKVVDEIKALRGKAIGLKVDVTKSKETNLMSKGVLDEWGRIDILVNNAGGAARGEMRSYFHDSKEEAWDFILGVNLKGVLNCCRAVVGHMVERRAGKIVNIGSVSGMLGSAYAMADYSAAKGGVIAFTKSLAKEVGCYGINVNCVSPGPIETEHFQTLSEDVIEKLKNTTYLGRLGKPEDIANMVAFLVSDEASFITGQNFAVCGGRSLGG
jgi:NAD(P)-dependent dehydrogenase (short-subunit alcohol dehydrogenase family)